MTEESEDDTATKLQMVCIQSEVTVEVTKGGKH